MRLYQSQFRTFWTYDEELYPWIVVKRGRRWHIRREMGAMRLRLVRLRPWMLTKTKTNCQYIYTWI
jgi:hypothetical protein